MSKLFEEMAQSTAEARAYMEGERKGYKVTLPESIRLHFSQGRFAGAFGLSVDVVRHEESGRRNPEAKPLQFEVATISRTTRNCELDAWWYISMVNTPLSSK